MVTRLLTVQNPQTLKIQGYNTKSSTVGSDWSVSSQHQHSCNNLKKTHQNQQYILLITSCDQRASRNSCTRASRRYVRVAVLPCAEATRCLFRTRGSLPQDVVEVGEVFGMQISHSALRQKTLRVDVCNNSKSGHEECLVSRGPFSGFALGAWERAALAWFYLFIILSASWNQRFHCVHQFGSNVTQNATKSVTFAVESKNDTTVGETMAAYRFRVSGWLIEGFVFFFWENLLVRDHCH